MSVDPGWTDGKTIWLPAASGAGRDAIELATGRLLATAPEAARPIGMYRGRLVALTKDQHDMEPFELQVAAFDEHGKRAMSSAKLVLPPWVRSPTPPLTTNFRISPQVFQDRAYIIWWARETNPEGGPFVDSGLTTVSLSTGQLTTGKRPALPLVLNNKERWLAPLDDIKVLCDSTFANSWKLGTHFYSLRAVQDGRAAALITWDAASRRPLRQAVLAEWPRAPDGREHIVLSPDWRYLWLWKGADPATWRPTTTSELLIYDATTGALLARTPWSKLRSQGASHLITVVASRILATATTPDAQRFQVYSLDGQLLWERRIPPVAAGK